MAESPASAAGRNDGTIRTSAIRAARLMAETDTVRILFRFHITEIIIKITCAYVKKPGRYFFGICRAFV